MAVLAVNIPICCLVLAGLFPAMQGFHAVWILYYVCILTSCVRKRKKKVNVLILGCCTIIHQIFFYFAFLKRGRLNNYLLFFPLYAGWLWIQFTKIHADTTECGKRSYCCSDMPLIRVHHLISSVTRYSKQFEIASQSLPGRIHCCQSTVDPQLCPLNSFSGKMPNHSDPSQNSYKSTSRLWLRGASQGR